MKKLNKREFIARLCVDEKEYKLIIRRNTNGDLYFFASPDTPKDVRHLFDTIWAGDITSIL